MTALMAEPMTLEFYLSDFAPLVRLRIAARYRIADDGLDELMGIVAEKVWRALETGWVRDNSQPMAWMYSIASHAALDWLRGRRREARHIIGSTDAHPYEAPDPAPGPERVADVAETRAAVRAAVAALPEAQAAMVSCLYDHGLTLSECSRHLHIPFGTAKSRWELGRRKLAVALAGVA